MKPLEVTGYRKAKTSIEELRYAAAWMLRRLLKTRTLSRVSIKVEFKEFKPKSWWAYVVPIDECPKPSRFRIIIQPRFSRKTILRLLAHELTHVKQLTRGEMEYAVGPIVLFRERYYDESKTAYLQRPWEVEAHKMELKLTREYLKHLEKEGISF